MNSSFAELQIQLVFFGHRSCRCSPPASLQCGLLQRLEAWMHDDDCFARHQGTQTGRLHIASDQGSQRVIEAIAFLSVIILHFFQLPFWQLQDPMYVPSWLNFAGHVCHHPLQFCELRGREGYSVRQQRCGETLELINEIYLWSSTGGATS